MAIIKKPQSAYFQFSATKRKQITEENPGIRIGDVQKLITAQWKELTVEEKQHFIDLAAKDKERYERERLENPVDEAAAQEEKNADAKGSTCLYPLGRVKRIIQSDPDVNKVSREALIAISKASELFAQFLATKSYEQTLYNNKRQIKTSDVTRAIQISSVLDWLREDFPDIKPTAAARSSERDATAAPSSSETGEAKPTPKPKPSAAAFFGQRATKPTSKADGEEAQKDGETETARDENEDNDEDGAEEPTDTAIASSTATAAVAQEEDDEETLGSDSMPVAMDEN